VSQVGEAAKEPHGEILFFISWVIEGRTDGRNPLRRFHEVLRIVRSCRGARRLQHEGSKSLKLRRDGAIDSGSQEPLDLHVVSCIWDSGVEAPKLCNERSEIVRRDIPARSDSFIWRTRVRRFSHLVDSDIEGPKGKSVNFASGEVARR
jgi:hypothetical protein